MGYRTFIREQIALGKLPYVNKVQLRGLNAAVTTSAETIWPPSSAYVQLTTAVALEVVSSSANDTANGTGARTVRIEYLDANYKTVSVDISMNGTSPVSVGTGLAVNSAKVLTAGSTFGNVGAIDVRAVSGGAIKRQIAATAGQSQDFFYTIPAGCTGLLCATRVTASGVTGTVIVNLLSKDSAGLIKNEARIDIGVTATSITPVTDPIELGTGIMIPEKTLIELQATVSTGVGIVSALGELLVFENLNSIVV